MSLFQKIFNAIVFIIALEMLWGCAPAKRQETEILPPAQEEIQQSPELREPELPIEEKSELKIIQPIVLILGPGRARAWANVGVLQALHEKKIPISAIVGVGTGAVIGALYATNESFSEFEWDLLRFEKAVYGEKKLFAKLFSTQDEKQKIINYTKEYLKTNRLENSKTPLHIGYFSQMEDRFILAQRGNAKKILEWAISDESENSCGMINAKSKTPYPVQMAKALRMGPVVSVLTTQNVGEIENSDLIIKPSLDGYSEESIDRRKEIIYLGKKEGLRAIGLIEGLGTGSK